MISLVEASNYKSLRYIRQALQQFHVLVGPNASGKTTFLDVPALLGQLVTDGLEEAITSRTKYFRDLVWQRSAGGFELAIEAVVPQDRREPLENKDWDTIRYEVAFGLHPDTGEIAILSEKVQLKTAAPPKREQRELFPNPPKPPSTIISPKFSKGVKTIVNKAPSGNDNFYDETGKGWDHSFKLGPRKSALANLPEDESKFPASTWLKSLLVNGVQQIILNSLLIRKASGPSILDPWVDPAKSLASAIDRKAPADKGA
jgi:hypothetical protein